MRLLEYPGRAGKFPRQERTRADSCQGPRAGEGFGRKRQHQTKNSGGQGAGRCLRGSEERETMAGEAGGDPKEMPSANAPGPRFKVH